MARDLRGSARRGGVLRMSNSERLRLLAEKSEDLAARTPDPVVRTRQLELASSYRRLADKEDFFDRRDSAP